MAPFDPYSQIDSFIVMYQLLNTSLPIETPRTPVIVSHVSSTTYTITDLLQDSTYKVVVYATTSVDGNSPPSEELIVTTTTTGKAEVVYYISYI